MVMKTKEELKALDQKIMELVNQHNKNIQSGLKQALIEEDLFTAISECYESRDFSPQDAKSIIKILGKIKASKELKKRLSPLIVEQSLKSEKPISPNTIKKIEKDLELKTF